MISTSKLRPCACLSRAWAAMLVAGALGAGCAAPQLVRDGALLGVVTPYRIEIVQGNVVTSEQAALIRPGMRREQVRDILGSPMLTSPFHEQRWDYVFTIRRQGAQPQQRSVVAHFKGDVLERLEVPQALPSEAEFVAAIDPVRRKPVARSLELSEEQRKALPAPSRPAAPAGGSTTDAPQRPYPPLEPT